MFYKNTERIYRVEPLDRLAWLRHGFGTRLSAPPEGKIATLRQIHSAKVVIADAAGCLGEGDALIGDTAGTLLAIRTADCLPILIVDEKRRAVAAVHAGWRGTAARIAAETVSTMARRFGSEIGDLHAAIGPGIGGCCFEVGPEVAKELVGEDRRMYVDLAQINRRQMLEGGIAPERIYSSELCTVCNGEEFYSFRRERAGRMLTFVGIADKLTSGAISSY